MNMSILTAYYYIAADILKEYLPSIPEFKLSNAKGYYGQIEYKGNDEFLIRLSKWNLDCGPIHWWDEEDIHELVETICHEFAHIIYWEHGKEHTELTEVFTRFVENKLRIRELDEKLNRLDEAV